MMAKKWRSERFGWEQRSGKTDRGYDPAMSSIWWRPRVESITDQADAAPCFVVFVGKTRAVIELLYLSTVTLAMSVSLSHSPSKALRIAITNNLAPPHHACVQWTTVNGALAQETARIQT